MYTVYFLKSGSCAAMLQPSLLLWLLTLTACQHSQPHMKMSFASSVVTEPELKDTEKAPADPPEIERTIQDAPGDNSTSNPEEKKITFEEFTKNFSRGRSSQNPGNGMAALEIFHEDTWFPLLDAPDLSHELGCERLSPTKDPGWRFDGETPLAVVFEESRAILYAAPWDSTCAKRLVLLQNRGPSRDNPQAFSKITFGYDEPDALAKELHSALVGDYLPSPGNEKIHITLDDVWVENSKKKKVFSHKTQFSDGDYHCAEVSVKLFETYGDELLLQIREGRSACVGADSGEDSFDTRVFRLVDGKSPALVSYVQASSSYMGKASGSADDSDFREEWELPVRGGVLIRQETKSSDSEDWSSEAGEDPDEDSELPVCSEGEVLLLRTTSSSSYHIVDWILRINGSGRIPLASVEVEPEKSDSSEELYCGQQLW